LTALRRYRYRDSIRPSSGVGRHGGRGYARPIDLTVDEIRSRFASEWVLVGDPELTESLVVIRGNVLWHSRDRDEVYRKARGLRPVHSTILYTGTLPDEAAVVL
jgi:hypothetical protein